MAISLVLASPARGQIVTSVTPNSISNDHDGQTLSVAGTGFSTLAATSVELRQQGGAITQTAQLVNVSSTTELTAVFAARAIGNRLPQGNYDLIVTVAGTASPVTEQDVVFVNDDHPDFSGTQPISANDTLKPGSTIVATRVVAGELGYASDVDIFAFPSTAGFLYRITARAAGAQPISPSNLQLNGVTLSDAAPFIFAGGNGENLEFFVRGLTSAIAGTYTVEVFLEPPSVTQISPTTASNRGDFDIDIFADSFRNPFGLPVLVGLDPGIDGNLVVTLEDPRFPIASAFRVHATGQVVSQSESLLKVRIPAMGLAKRPHEYRVNNPANCSGSNLADCGVQIFVSVNGNKSSTGPSTVMTFDDDHPHTAPDSFNPSIKLAPRNPQDLILRNSSGSGSMDYGGDRDAFILKPERGKVFTVIASSGSLDPTLEIQEPPTSSHSDYQTLICTDDIHPAELILTSPRNRNARATFVTTLEEDYYIIIDAFGTGGCTDPETGRQLPDNSTTQTGNYTVSVAQDEHPTCPEDTIPRYDEILPDGVLNNSQINFLGDIDTFQFSAEVGKTYLIEVTQPGDAIPSFGVNLFGKLGTCAGTNLISTTSAQVARLTTTAFIREFNKVQVSASTSAFDNYPLDFQIKIIEGSLPSVASVTPTTKLTNSLSHELTIAGLGLKGPNLTQVSLIDVTGSSVGSLSVTSATSTQIKAVLQPGAVGQKLKPGTYGVRVSTDFGTSVLVSTAQVEITDDHLDTFTAIQADPNRAQDLLSAGTFKAAEIGYINDADLFRMSVVANTQYRVELQPGISNPLTTASIQVLNSFGTLVGQALSPSAVSFVATTATAPSNPTTHFVRVSPPDITKTGNFQIRYVELPVPIITSISPQRPGRGSNRGGAPLTTLTIRGNNFLVPAKVTSARLNDAGTTPLIIGPSSVVSNAEVTGTIAARHIGAQIVPGIYNVLLTNGQGEGPALDGGKIQLEDDHPESLGAVNGADRVPIGGSITADRGFPGDVDGFFFGPTSVGQHFQLQVLPLATFDPVLTLFSQFQAPLSTNDDIGLPGAPLASRIAFTATAQTQGTTNFLMVSGKTATSTGTYSVMVVPDDHPDTRESLEAVSLAADLLATDAVAVVGSTDLGGEVDVFKFVTKAAVGYEINVAPSGVSPVTSVLVELLGPSGSLSRGPLVSSTNAKITTTIGLSGEPANYVRVTSPTTGTYSITVEAVNIPAVSSVTPGATFSNKGGAILTVTHDGADLSLGIDVRDGSGARVSVPFSDVTVINSSTFSFMLPVRSPPALYRPGTGHIIVKNTDGESPLDLQAAIEFVDDHPAASSGVSSTDQISPGDAAIAAEIGFPSDVDIFRFTSQVGVTYVVQSLRGTVSTAIAVFDGLGQALPATLNFTSDSTLATVKAPVTGGDVFIAISALTGGQTGSYTLQVLTLTTPVVTGVIPIRGLNDRATSLTLTGSGFSGAFEVRLDNAATTLLTTPVVSGDSSLRTTVPAGVTPGRFNVIVKNSLGFNSASSDRFEVDDHPNAFASTGQEAIVSPRDDVIVNAPPVTAFLESSSDRDYFRFSVIAGHVYQVQTTAGTLSDTFLSIFGIDGTTLIAENDNVSAVQLHSLLSFTADTSGVFYARVATLGTGSGSYRLSIIDTQSDDDHANSALTAAIPRDQLVDGVVSSGAIDYGDDVDFFRFDAVAGAVYDVETTLGSITDTELALFDTNGTDVLAANDDNPDNVTSTASKIVGFQPRTSGVYYVRVKHHSKGVPTAVGSYTVALNRRAASLSVQSVVSDGASLSAGQATSLSVFILNSGTRSLTNLISTPRFLKGAASRNVDYDVQPVSGNPLAIDAGVQVLLRYQVTVAPSAQLGEIRIDATADAQDAGASISDGASFVTTTVTIQTPAQLFIRGFTAPAQVSRGQTVMVSMTLGNSGQASASITSASLRFVGSGGVSRDGDYTVTARPGNPTAVAGVDGPPGTAPKRTDLGFDVTVASEATEEIVVINGSYGGADVNSGRILEDDSASAPLPWSVQTTSSLFISSLVVGSTVSQGQTTRVAMNLENPGQSPVTLLTSGLKFAEAGGPDRTGDYTVTPVSGNPTTIAAQGKSTLFFDVLVGAAAARGAITIDGTVTARDDRTSDPLNVPRSNLPAQWQVQLEAALVIDALSLSPSRISRTGSVVVSMTVRNSGEAAVRVATATARLLTASGGVDRTGAFRIGPAAPVGSVLAGGQTTSILLTAAPGTLATTEVLRVSASVDGNEVNTGRAVSGLSPAQSDPTFRVADIFITVAAPVGSARLFFDEPIRFTGSARDDEGAPLAGSSLSWVSNFSGVIGTGETFTTTLVAATHLITLTAAGGAGFTSSSTFSVVVEGPPPPATSLTVSGALRRQGTQSPLAAGFQLELANGNRNQTGTGTVSGTGGAYSVTFSGGATVVARAGDLLIARIREPGGLNRPTVPSSVVLLSRDIVNGSRVQNFTAADLSEQFLTLERGANLIGLAISPATTTAMPFMASDLARASGTPFVVRSIPEAGSSVAKFDSFVVGLGGQDFALQGNEGYLVFSPSDQVITLRGTRWPQSTLSRRLAPGANWIALPRGVPPGFTSDDLGRRSIGAIVFGRLLTRPSGNSLFEFHKPGFSSPFPIVSGMGYLIGTPRGGEVLLPEVP